MKNVNALLKKEQQVKDILANIEREKQELAINKLAEVKEILAALDCSYLLETDSATAIERIVEKAIINKGKIVEVVKEANPVNVTITKGKIVKVPGKVQVVQDMTEIEKYLDTITAQKKEIESLKKSIAKWKEIAETTQKDFEAKDKQMDEICEEKAKREARINELVALLEESNKEVAQLKKDNEELSKNNKTLSNNVAISFGDMSKAEEDAYMEFLASQENDIMSEINAYGKVDESQKQKALEKEEEKKEESKEENKEESPKQDSDAPRFVKVANNVVGNNPKAKLYQTEKCYLIASPTTDEITWLSNEELSNEYKIAVENMLVQNYKFLPNRTKLSPIKINRENSYMARANAANGITEFSMDDVLVGYVKVSNKFYLYSYRPKYARPKVESLDILLTENPYTTVIKSNIIKKVTEEVLDMYKEYKSLVEYRKEEDNKKAEESAKQFNKKVEARRAQFNADKDIVANSGLLNKDNKYGSKNNNVVIDNSSVVTSGTILDDIEDELF